ncbi:hypothetical protein PsorP6_017204 [Peronosclerospora sorghi]|uniref:Uncharacterized protein n=1 Tax=Peronosclerospora sorghi TaxID=230839 RepID=A0ACC0WFI7_9STRA|nr:hypothetical protein PsorP6_017204 [Peronosclerospora sorghi]
MMEEKLFGIQTRLYGDASTKASERFMSQDRALWVSNHRTRIDWMLLWCVAWRTRTLHRLRIVLKAPLRNIPIFGWAMQHFHFIFLQRRWVDDQVNLRKVLPYLTSTEPEASYLFFPEGTDLSESNLEKSVSFAIKNGLPPRRYSLYPRTKGWTFMLPLLRSQLTAIYDITMFYVDYAANERPSEKSLITGRVPRCIHFYIERVDISAVPGNSETDLATWLDKRFEQKECMLQAFYESNGKLPDGAQPLLLGELGSDRVILVIFWLVLIGIAIIDGWFGGGFSSLIAAFSIIAFYCIITAYGSGVDGYFLESRR